MAHTYASLAEAMQYAHDGGTPWGATSTNNDRALAILESSSRRIDEWCGRSAFGSGFGPRSGTNRYDGAGERELFLRDDLISGTVTSAATYGATPVSLTVETDYLRVNARRLYEPAPYRSLILHGSGALSNFGTGLQVTSVAGTWGHQSVTRTLTPTTAEDLDASETVIDVSALGELSAGMTILIDSEQMYVRSTTDATPDTITVDRGVNGTTAAAHTTGKAIARYLYDSAVVDATLRLWLRRWRARDAGADGVDGGGDMGTVVPREGEDTILRRTVGHLRLGALVRT